jgi:pimeloyl-ACP methyl ester carboxylesterase
VRRFVVIAATIGVVTAGPVVALPAPSLAAPSATSTITWGTCAPSTGLQAPVECGFLSVPLDYADPNGAKIKIAVSRVRHTSKSYQGIMLVNPGGPGGSGLGLSTLGSAVPKVGATDVAGQYDWIGFDPRGVGSSQPALTCNPFYDPAGGNRPDYIPAPGSKGLPDVWLDLSKGYADACKTNGPILQHMTTIDVARDMDSIRMALGQQKINYYGFSYGTYLGQVYSTLFPTHVRRMVLDSNVDPRNIWYVANLNQDVAFDRNIDIWFGWIAKYDAVYHLGKTEQAVRSLFYSIERNLAVHPAAGAVQVNGQSVNVLIGPDEWVDIFLGAGYYQQTWLQLGSVFAGYVNKNDVNTLANMYYGTDTPGNDNGFAVYNGVQCTDVQWPLSLAKWNRDNRQIYQTHPFETWGNAWFNAPCLYWPAKAHKPLTIQGNHLGILLIDETLDAATPFEGSEYVRSIFRGASLLAEPGGTTHADSLSGNTCVDGTVATYLLSGTLPPRRRSAPWDMTCAPLPVPVPTASGQPATAAPVRVRPLIPGRLLLPFRA